MYNVGMSIQELSSKFKGILANPEYQLAILIVFVALASFTLGRLSDGNFTQAKTISTEIDNTAHLLDGTVKNTQVETTEDESKTDFSVQDQGKYVASKNGTKYHLPWCGSAKRIKEENEVWFATKTEAESAGYSPAKNCKGI